MLKKIILSTLLLLLMLITEAVSYPFIAPSHNIRVKVDLKNHTIDAVDRLVTDVAWKNEIAFSIHKNVTISEIRDVNGQELRYLIRDDKDQKKVAVRLPVNKSISEIEIHFSGRFPDMPGDVEFSREFLGDKPVVYAGEEIILLDGSACWHPCVDWLSAFNVTTITPSGYEVVMEGTRVARQEGNGEILTSWDFPHPVAGIYLVGGKYVIKEDLYNDIAVYTYFFAEDAGLAQNYIDYTKKYLEIYEGMFGKYPFHKFAVVENILPTGFGMPSYTLLGQKILRLPFMVKTSLGHEIAHNWWGNYVYPDYKTGNWSEGLTTYVADYLYDEMEGKGVSYRRQLLRDYANYTDHKNEYSLKRFVRRKNPSDMAIGYGRGAYVFHMLRVMMGDETFYKGLRDVIANNKFKAASWDDFKYSFEKVSGRNLGWFFRQWLEEAGGPQITLGEVEVVPDGAGYVINALISLMGEEYEIYLPVSVETGKGSLLSHHWIRGPLNTIEIQVSSRPKSITLDPGYDIFRRLNKEEIPPTIGRFTGENNKLIIIPSGSGNALQDAYARAAEILEGSLKIERPPLPSLIKIENDTISISGRVYDNTDAVLAVALESPYNKGNTVLFISGKKPEDIISVGERLSHYGKYSYLLFIKGENVEKGIWDAEMLGRDLHENE